jgi:hypothetical protein
MTNSSENRRRRLERAERENAPESRRKTVIRGKRRITLVARSKQEMALLELFHAQIEALTGRGPRRAALRLPGELR